MTDIITLKKLTELVCDNLPEDWRIRMDFAFGELSVELENPDGDDVELCDDDLTLSEVILSRVNHARESDGLGLVDLDGKAVAK